MTCTTFSPTINREDVLLPSERTDNYQNSDQNRMLIRNDGKIDPNGISGSPILLYNIPNTSQYSIDSGTIVVRYDKGVFSNYVISDSLSGYNPGTVNGRLFSGISTVKNEINIITKNVYPVFIDSLLEHSEINDLGIKSQVDLIYSTVSNVAKKESYEFLNNYPIGEPIFEEDGNVIIEWDFPNLILIFDIDSDPKYSSWALTIRNNKGEFSEDGGRFIHLGEILPVINRIFPKILNQEYNLEINFG